MDYGEILKNLDKNPQKTETLENEKKPISNNWNNWWLGKLKWWFNSWISIKNLNIDFIKNILSKLDINWFTVFVTFLWISLIWMAIYWYNTDLHSKIKQLPTLQKNVSISENNIEKQKKELEALDNLTINDDELSKKEKIMLSNIEKEWDLTAIYQAYKLYQIAKDSWLDIEWLQKVVIQPDDNKIQEFWDKMAVLQIGNIYDSSWYNKFILTATTDEETLMKFQKNIEESLTYSYDWFTIVENQWELKYSFSIKAFYSLTKN